MPAIPALWLAVAGCGGGEPPPSAATAVPSEAPIAKSVDTSDRASVGWLRDGLGAEARAAIARREFEGALELLERVRAEAGSGSGERAAASVVGARLLLDLGQSQRAEQWLREGIDHPELAPIRATLATWGARAVIEAGTPERAATWLARAEGSPERVLWEAEAAYAVGAMEQAERHARAYVAGTPVNAARGYELLVAVALAGERSEDAEAAYASLLRVDAAHRIRDRRVSKFVRTRAPGESDALDEVRRALRRRNYGEVERRASALLRKKLKTGVRCELYYLRGQAKFRDRRRADARPDFDRATTHCRKAGSDHVDTLVRAQYQSARGRYAAGQYSRAAAAFEALAKRHADHSYADDAWILAGESWIDAGRLDAARAAYDQGAAVGGDMRDEAIRRLVVTDLQAGDMAGLQARATTALALPRLGQELTAKLHYYRGRALASQGDASGAESAYLDAIREQPLGYPSLQAFSRLAEADAEAFARGVVTLRGSEASAGPELQLPESPAATRARLWAALGFGEEVRKELRAAKVRGWPAAAVLADAGMYPETQKMLANLDHSWQRQPPAGELRTHWELAFPRPFEELVPPREQQHGVPSELAYAIMLTESRFDPNATSRVGARGLVQLMPATAKDVARRLGVQLPELDALYQPALNLDLGVAYLGRLVARYGGGHEVVPLAVAGYNGGPGSVDRWLRERPDATYDLFIEAIPYDETRNYTQHVLGRWMTYRWMYGEGSPQDRIPRLPLATPSVKSG